MFSVLDLDSFYLISTVDLKKEMFTLQEWIHL